jgi:hypothetical protein
MLDSRAGEEVMVVENQIKINHGDNSLFRQGIMISKDPFNVTRL